MKELKKKSDEELKRLNTKNLLAYYRAERKRFYSFVAGETCDCGCNDFKWDIYETHENERMLYEEWESYISNIKNILNGRGHVVGFQNKENIRKQKAKKQKHYSNHEHA